MADVPQRIGLISDGLGNWALAHKDEAEIALHFILATPEALAAASEVQALIRAAKAEGMREAAGMLQEHFGVPLRPEAAWSDAEKAAYDKGQQEASDLTAERILAAAEKLHRKPGEISFGCCCVGPINAEPECPCKMRARRVKPNP